MPLDPSSVANYLRRLGVSGGDLATLHESHLLRVPFENLIIHRGEPIELRTELLFEKIVSRRRGGFCYELNGLFAELLEALGHRVERLAARVYKADGTLGIPFDHLCLRVDDTFLCDVGFGDCFVRPLRLEDGEQHDGRTAFRLSGGTLSMLERTGAWEPQYHFELTPYALHDFANACHYHQTSPDSPFTKKRVCSQLTVRGRITLTADRLIERSDGETKETPVAPEAWSRALVEHFGIDLDRGAKILDL